MAHRIVFLALDDFQSLDLFGPLEVFATSRNLMSCPYECRIASFSYDPVRSVAGTRILPDITLTKKTPVDTLVLCGGRGPRTTTLSTRQKSVLDHLCGKATRVVSICTGAFLLAQLDVTSGKRVATHWQNTDELTRIHPDLEVEDNALFVQDGKVWSTAGVTAGIDLALALVGKDHGPTIAASVAQYLVVYMRRPGGQAQFSKPLSIQAGDSGRIAPLLDWLSDNLASPLHVNDMAERLGLSPRQFNRIFQRTIGMPPAKFLEQMRLDRARILLSEQKSRIDDVAKLVGYRSTDSFRRAFERKFLVAPSHYQQQFSSDAQYQLP